MNPGLLRERIELKAPTTSSQNRYGEMISTFTTSSIWANVKKQGGNEVNNSGLIMTSATYIFTIRSRDDATEKSIITYNNKDYDVVFVDDLYNFTYKKLTTERRS